jgi:hypothetical protein
MLCDKLYTEQQRRHRLREVRRQETELARQASKNFSTGRQIDQASQVREEAQRAYQEKASLLQELEMQRESALLQVGNAHRLAESKEREDFERAREKEEWLRQAADRAVERGRAALVQASDWARSKEDEETYLIRRREEVLAAESAKAKQLAAAWNEKQRIEAERKASEDAANYIPPGGLVVRGQMDFSKTHFHNPVILKHEISQKTAQDLAAETSAEAEVRLLERQALQEDQKRVAWERGQEALTKEQLKIEHSRLISELEKLRKADGELKAAQGAREQTSTSRISLTKAKKEAQKKQRAERQFQEIFLSAGKSSILENIPSKNVWEQRRLEAGPTKFNIPEVPGAPEAGEVSMKSEVPRRIVLKEGDGADPFESLISSYRSQSTPSLRQPSPKIQESSQISEEEEEDLEESKDSQAVSDNEEEESLEEKEEEAEEDEAEEDYEYSEVSSESEQEQAKLPANYRLPGSRQTRRREDDDALIRDLTAKDPEVNSIWGEVKGSLKGPSREEAPYKSHSEVLELENSSYRSSPASSFSKPPVPRLEKVSTKKSEQYYTDLLTTPAFSKNQPTFRPLEEEKSPGDLGLYSAAKASLKESLLSESFNSLLYSRSAGQKSQDFDKYLRSEPSDTFKLSQTDDLKYSKTEAQVPGELSYKVDIEQLLQSKKEPLAWEVESKPEKRKVPVKQRESERPYTAPEAMHTQKPPPRKASVERHGEVWDIELETGTQQRSLADAFLAKKRDLAGKLERREVKSKEEPKKEKSKEELQAIRKQMLKGRSHPIEVEVNKTQPANSKLMGRLASGERVKVIPSQVSKDEMKQLTAKNYDNLPEVKAKRLAEAKRAQAKKRIADAKEFEKVRARQKRKESRLKRIAG